MDDRSRSGDGLAGPPTAATRDAGTLHPWAAPRPSGLRHAAREHCRVLVADDDADTRRIRVLALAHAGYECCTAADGDTACALASDMDVVVTEMYLRSASAVCVVAPIVQLRGTAQRPRVLIYTSYASPRDRRWADASGADACIVKPARLHDVVDAVATLAALGVAER